MLNGLMEQSTVGCFPELCFLSFSVAQVFLGLGKQFINNSVFFYLACDAGFNNNVCQCELHEVHRSPIGSHIWN